MKSAFPSPVSAFRPLLATAAVGLLAVAGCASAPDPSDQQRAEPLAGHEHLIAFDRAAIMGGVYYLVSIEDDFKTFTIDTATGNTQGEYTGTKSFKQALAVAIDRRGYLLTAQHVLSAHNYVIGEFGHGFEIRRARVVQQGDAANDLDYAILQVEAELPLALDLAPDPKAGDVVFAVIFDKNDHAAGGARLFTAGQVRGTYPVSSGTVIDSTLPIRAGDSGGPVLTPEGKLVGVTQGWKHTFHGFSGEYAMLTVRPAEAVIRRAIDAGAEGK
jgi:S1-C subfamily serine protease